MSWSFCRVSPESSVSELSLRGSQGEMEEKKPVARVLFTQRQGGGQPLLELAKAETPGEEETRTKQDQEESKQTNFQRPET